MRRVIARTLVAVVLAAFHAHAQSAPIQPTFRTQVANCPEELARRLPAVVKLEIDVLLRERALASAPPEAVAIRCDDGIAGIEVTIGGVSRRATIDLSDLASDHRARALALAVAELAHSMHNQGIGAFAPASPPDSAAAIVPEEPERAAPPGAKRSPPRPTLLLGGLGELVGKPAALLLGARLELLYPAGSVVVPAVTIDGAIGTIQTQSASVAVKAASVAVHLYLGTNTGKVRWDLGPGASFGWIHLAGLPDAGVALAGRSLAAAWGGPEIRGRIAYLAVAGASAGAGVEPFRSPTIAFELAAGLVALPVRGMLDDTRHVYSVEGPWASACVEVGLGL
ncbi:MAG TPA: hypothetical protein VF881_01040 [Polyangiaceae bacterium]